MCWISNRNFHSGCLSQKIVIYPKVIQYYHFFPFSITSFDQIQLLVAVHRLTVRVSLKCVILVIQYLRFCRNRNWRAFSFLSLIIECSAEYKLEYKTLIIEFCQYCFSRRWDSVIDRFWIKPLTGVTVCVHLHCDIFPFIRS